MQIRKKHNKTNGTMWKWFYSYSAALLLPIVFGVAIYLFSANMIYDQAERLQDQNAAKDYSYLEQILEGVASIGQNILLNDDVTSFADERRDRTRDAVQMRKVQDLLVDFRLANKALESLYVFYPQEGLIISDTNWHSMTENTVLDMSSMLYLYDDAFLPVISGNPYNRVYLVEKNGAEYLFYTCSREGRKNFMDQEAVVMLSIDCQLLNQQLKGNTTSALILATEDQAEVSLEAATLMEFGNETLAASAREYLNTGNDEEYFSGNDYYLQKQVLSDYGLTMWNVYSNEESRDEMSRIWQILIIYVACCMVIGPILVFWISRRNYTPVEKLISTMESSGLKVGEQNEFAAIHQSMLGLLKGMRDQQKAIRQQKKFYEESALYYLLCTDKVLSGSETHLVQDFNHDGFLVVSFDAEDAKEVLRTEDSKEEQEMGLLYFVIDNVVREFFADFPFEISGKLNELYYVILNFPAEEFAEYNGMVQEKTRNICRFLQEQFQFSICANISRLKKSRESLTEAYAELREIEEFRNYIGSEEIVLRYDTFSDDEEIRREMNYFTDIGRLSELLRGHRHMEAETLLTEIRETYHTAEWMATDEKEAAAPAEEQERAGKSAEQTIRKVEEYLQEHYLDPQITVSSVAFLFELNPSYLSRSFCKITGKGMLEYLTAMRLEHAKKCMEAGESVNAAAEHSGFYTCRPLIRAFKNEMGVTPGEYYKNKKR